MQLLHLALSRKYIQQLESKPDGKEGHKTFVVRFGVSCARLVTNKTVNMLYFSFHPREIFPFLNCYIFNIKSESMWTRYVCDMFQIFYTLFCLFPSEAEPKTTKTS